MAINLNSDGSSKLWSQNQVVKLPDMRGHAIYAADNMGGIAAGVIPNGLGNQIGQRFGSASTEIKIQNMPSHTHAMTAQGNHGHSLGAAGAHTPVINAAGAHQHGMSYSGNHGHNLRTSAFQGSGGARSDWPYFEGKARPNYQNTIPYKANGASAVQPGGNHKHTINSAGNHGHTARAVGNHKHTIGAAGNHTHVNNAAGGGQAVNTLSPGMVFNIEMKY